MNYFEFYDLVPSYHIDKAALKKLYYSKMRSFHPDMHIGSSVDKQAEIMELSSINNAAFKTLGDDHMRLKYLVDTYGKKTANLKLPADFLMEMMEINESIMELSIEPHKASVSKMQEALQKRQDLLFDDVQAILEHCKDFRQLEDSKIESIHIYLLKTNYLNRLVIQLDHIFEK